MTRPLALGLALVLAGLAPAGELSIRLESPEASIVVGQPLVVRVIVANGTDDPVALDGGAFVERCRVEARARGAEWASVRTLLGYESPRSRVGPTIALAPGAEGTVDVRLLLVGADLGPLFPVAGGRELRLAWPYEGRTVRSEALAVEVGAASDAEAAALAAGPDVARLLEGRWSGAPAGLEGLRRLAADDVPPAYRDAARLRLAEGDLAAAADEGALDGPVARRARAGLRELVAGPLAPLARDLLDRFP